MHEEYMAKGPGTGGVELDDGPRADGARTRSARRDAARSARSSARRSSSSTCRSSRTPSSPRSTTTCRSSQSDLLALQRAQGPARGLGEDALGRPGDVDSSRRAWRSSTARLKKLPKHIKRCGRTRRSRRRHRGLRASLPLIQNLKNDALRPRHWEKLMEVTEVSST